MSTPTVIKIDGKYSKPKGDKRGLLEVTSPLEINKVQLTTTAASSEAERRPQRPPDEAGHPPEPAPPPTLLTKRAHPEGHYFVNKDGPREAFLRRQRAKLGAANPSDQVTLAAPPGASNIEALASTLQEGEPTAQVAVPPDLAESPSSIKEPKKPLAFKDILVASFIPDLNVPALPAYPTAAARTRPSTPVPLSEPDDDDDPDVENLDLCDGCESEVAAPGSKVKDIGQILYSHMGSKNELRMIPVLDVRRPSILSNPFTMKKDESQRNAVCDAYQEWWRRRTATVDEICRQLGVTRAQAWSGSEVAASEDRLRGAQPARPDRLQGPSHRPRLRVPHW